MEGIKIYKGPDRRRTPRRVNNERREMIRWEPTKENRRDGAGRRGADETWRDNGNAKQRG